MKKYYISRAVVSAFFGWLFVLAGSTWWTGALVGALAFLWFLAAPRLGRYAVDPDRGFMALQRDERTSAIHNTAARNAFVICMLAAGGVVLYAASQSMPAVPVALFQALLALGALVYYASDFWLRRAQ